MSKVIKLKDKLKADAKPSKVVKLTDEEYLALLDKVPMRVCDITPELDYWFKKEPDLSDKIEMMQGLLRTLRIYDYGSKIQKRCKLLYEQGILFDHSEGGIVEGEAVKRKDKRTKEEIMDEPTPEKEKEKKDIHWFAKNFISPKPKKESSNEEV